MSTYIIGDIQGCLTPLIQLLEHIKYDPTHDQLAFVGDLINRGPQSLETLRFIKSLKHPLIVLGNHDIALLAMGYNAIPIQKEAPHDILNAPDKLELLDWLRQQPLAIALTTNTVLVHAGIPPQWTLTDALHYSKIIEEQLQNENITSFLNAIWGNEPLAWHPNKSTPSELHRYIINALTRMRFCTEEGTLELSKTLSEITDTHFQPWFSWPRADNIEIIFGHWAMLNGHCDASHCYALDTGYVYGGALTAMRLEDKKRFSIKNPKL